MNQDRWKTGLLLFSLVALVGCPEKNQPVLGRFSGPSESAARHEGSSSKHDGAKSSSETSSSGVAIADLTHFVPLEALDEASLPEELAKTIHAAIARIPERVSRDQQRALEELESRCERLEAELEGEDGMPFDLAAQGRLRAVYFWERLRIFAPDLPVDAPEALAPALERRE